MKKHILFLLLCAHTFSLLSQAPHTSKKKRLDFAQTYFELGGSFLPSFTGAKMIDNEISSFKHPSSFRTHLYWGGFHFWGHAEFFVSFPLSEFKLNKNEDSDFSFSHATATGARFLPWAYEERKLRPYIGVGWAGLDFKQIIKPDSDQPLLQNNFTLMPDIGVLYGFEQFAARLGVNFFPHNKWDYPLSKTDFQQIKTPNFSVQLGLVYSFEQSKSKNEEINERWNDYPTVSPLGIKSYSKGDFFIGVGPSGSFSLSNPTYNQDAFPFLNKKQSSNAYFDVALGYQFNKLGLFTALSFRNPTFENKAFGVEQIINKTSLTLEVNKFLTDYSGFVPYIGLNLAADRLRYTESINSQNNSLIFQSIEPGLTFGWDILPGKTDEFLILRTNLRWYPFSSFEVKGKPFEFSQLEYNLIQVVFFPERFMRSRNRR